MQTHHRRRTDGADRQTTTSRRRWVITAALILTVPATACGSTQAADSVRSTSPDSTSPVSLHDDDVLADTIAALDVIGIQDDGATVTGTGDDDDRPDYTDAELDVLLDVEPSDENRLDSAEDEPLEADPPAAAIEAIEVALDESPRTAVEGTPILDQVEPIDDAPTEAAFGIRDGRHVNEAGEAIRLDETAGLACANVEIALTALDEKQPAEAAGHLRTASTMAAGTTVSAMNPWSPILRQAADDLVTDTTNGDASALLAFLTTCTQGGYEL